MSKSATSIEIRDLYKIFGANPKAHVEAVRNGMSKTELGDVHGHILGLNNINISMPAGKIQVIMGLSGSGKSTLIRCINRLEEHQEGRLAVDGVDGGDRHPCQKPIALYRRMIEASAPLPGAAGELRAVLLRQALDQHSLRGADHAFTDRACLRIELRLQPGVDATTWARQQAWPPGVLTERPEDSGHSRASR